VERSGTKRYSGQPGRGGLLLDDDAFLPRIAQKIKNLNSIKNLFQTVVLLYNEI
jgi:hypothetical protein